ncbi:Golgi transport complex subunit 1 [Mortierella claussenii]|nr:Golgi transport complex subunit 1 [Mortierella claussenii]
MTTTTATGLGTAGPVDADELFMKLSVPELNVYERRTRQDIENKKQELRTMVGERYRDLIGAADCIVRMKETAFAVQDNIARMRESCDVHALKRSVAAKTKKAQSGEIDDMKKSLYTSAAQIKLLADVPEQIWRNMESSSYLTASRLYLISKAIYKNLSVGMEDHDSQSVKVMTTFPVVGRQWDAVSHFKAQILQKSHLHLKSARESDLNVIETICAIMLLDDVTMKDTFRLFLAQRQTAIGEALDARSESERGQEIGARIVDAINILQRTLLHVSHVFLESHGTGNDSKNVSQLERHLRCLQQSFSSPSASSTNTGSLAITTLPKSNLKDETHVLAPSALPSAASSNLAASVIPKLYPTTPNIHLLVRYLPDSVQNYTPFIHLEGPRAALTQQDVLQGVRRWMTDVTTMFSSECEKLLQQVQTSTALVAIRSKVWTMLRSDELALASTTKKSAFNDTCRILLGEPVSIWNTILRPSFSKTFQDVLVFSLDELSHQPERLLRPRLAELDVEDDPNHDIGNFIWNDQGATKGSALPTATEPLIRRIHEYVSGRTDLVTEVTNAFEVSLTAIRTDQEQALVCRQVVPSREVKRDQEDGEVDETEDYGEDEEDADQHQNLDLFGAKADTREFIEYYQKYCVECIKDYTLGLEQLVKEAVQRPEKARNTMPAVDRAMTIGRVALGIATMGESLQRALMPPAPTRDRSLSSSFAQARAFKTNVEALVQGLATELRRVYLVSHEAWIDSLEWSLSRSIKHYLADSSWTDLAMLAWEPIPTVPTVTTKTGSTIQTRNSSDSKFPASPAAATDDTKTLLPFHGSTRLIAALHQIVQEMHRVGAVFLRPELIQILTGRLAQVILLAVNQFLDSATARQDNNEELTTAGTYSLDATATLVTERGAIQLLFDLKLVNMVFQSSLEKDVELNRLTTSVINRVRKLIDPINLAVFEKPLDSNADRQYSRVAVLLGLLVQLNPAESKRKTHTVEKSPHIFAMAPLSARFTLLPVGQKMTGRVVYRSTTHS